MASKQNRKLSGAILTGAFITPAIMSAAQQNVASADFSQTANEFVGWAKNGLAKHWSNPIGKIGIVSAGIILLGLISWVSYLRFKGSSSSKNVNATTKIDEEVQNYSNAENKKSS